MERWIGYALASMCFAGFTAVLAKAGLQGISSDLAMGIRTIFVAVFVLLFCAWVVDPAERSALTWSHVGWLALSALATAASWVFYYKACRPVTSPAWHSSTRAASSSRCCWPGPSLESH